MAFRNDETKTFPVEFTDKIVWYAIIVFDGRFPRYAFTSSKSGKKDFVNKISELKYGGQKYLLLGIWQGNWKTDIFVLDEDMIVQRLSKVI